MEVIVFVIHSVIFFDDLENSFKVKKGGWEVGKWGSGEVGEWQE
jgi:hypothetical protein